MKFLNSLFAAVIGLAGLAILFAAPAAAAPTVVVGPGTGISSASGPPLNNPVIGGSCSITAVGHDNAGRLVAITAGHCVKNSPLDAPGSGTPGSPVYKTAGGQRIGEWTANKAFTNVPPPTLNVDYGVILLDADVVIPENTSEDGNLTVNSFGTASPIFNNLCKDGIGTGFTCGLIIGQSANSYSSYAFSSGGDSGGAAVRQGTTTLIGMTIGAANGNIVTGPFIYNKIQPVLNAINANGGVGAGFTLVP